MLAFVDEKPTPGRCHHSIFPVLRGDLQVLESLKVSRQAENTSESQIYL